MKQLIEENDGLQADKIDMRRISEEEMSKQQEHYENRVYEVEEKNLEVMSQN